MIKNKMKGLFCRFQQSLEVIKTLTAKELSKTGPFLNLSNHVFRNE